MRSTRAELGEGCEEICVRIVLAEGVMLIPA
jgi:hypothetical protein